MAIKVKGPNYTLVYRDRGERGAFRTGNNTVKVGINLNGLSSLQEKIAGLLNKLQNLEEPMRELAQYMVNATKNRILITKESPSGEPWKENTDLTRQLKGHASILRDTEDLYFSIKASKVDGGGFEVEAGAPYAGYMQYGTRKIRGKYRRDYGVPKRPFMGFSEANLKAIATRLRKHISNEGTSR